MRAVLGGAEGPAEVDHGSGVGGGDDGAGVDVGARELVAEAVVGPGAAGNALQGMVGRYG